MTDPVDNWYSEDTATLGDRLAAAREAAGLTQEELASRLGVKVSALEAWEIDRKEPRANRLQTLSGLLGVSIRWLLSGVGDDLDDHVLRGETPPDVHQILLEMRKVHSQMAECAMHLADLERKLRKAWETV